MNELNFIQETQDHIKKVGYYLSLLIKQLVSRANTHDMSKIGNEKEHDIFKEFTPKLKSSTYGSTEYAEFLKEMKKALDSHYAGNNHHPEHYINGICGMSLIDLMEMICDWKAATLRHNDGNLIRSIEQNQKRWGYSDEIKQILLNTIVFFEDTI